MRGFWNDSDGLTTVDILTITLGFGTAVAYWKFGCVDTNYADIVVASLIASAGQKVGVNWTRKGGNINADYRNEPPI